MNKLAKEIINECYNEQKDQTLPYITINDNDLERIITTKLKPITKELNELHELLALTLGRKEETLAYIIKNLKTTNKDLTELLKECRDAIRSPKLQHKIDTTLTKYTIPTH